MSNLRTATDDVSLSNVEMEVRLLGALLSDDHLTLWPQILGKVRPEHFSEHIHSRIFEAAERMASAGTVPSALTLNTFFAKDTTLTELGGTAYLAHLVANAGTRMNVRGDVEVLADLSARRAALEAIRETAEQAQVFTPGESFRKTIAQHIEAMQALFEKGSTRRTDATLGDAGQAMLERIERMRRGDADPNAVSTGLAAFDKQTGGLHRGEYIVLGARPGMGKTAISLQISYNIARAGGGVVYFSMEMPHHQLVTRLASTHLWTPGGATNVPYFRINSGSLSEMETRWMSAFAREVNGWPFIIDDAPGLSPAEMEARAQVAKSRLERGGHQLSLIVVDHLHKMRFPGSQSKVAEFTEISARLAEMAKRLNCPVLTLAQLSRGVESRDDKRPQLSDLRESGSIEQDADVAMFLYRPAYYLEREEFDDLGKEAERIQSLRENKNRLDLIVQKQRSGPVGTVPLYCDIECNAVHDVFTVDPSNMGNAA